MVDLWLMCASISGLLLAPLLALVSSPICNPCSFRHLKIFFLIGSFGASAVLVYGAIQSPLAQPRNLIGGHVVSAIVGVTVGKLLPDVLWLTAPLAVAASIVLMQVTNLTPPGGATALIAVSSGTKIASMGYAYVLSPVFTGAFILFVVALVFNNITKKRHYPVRGSRLRRSRRDQLRRRFRA